jgi:uncharacterized protein with LGFP repeats
VTGARALWGPVLHAYLSRGGATGWLGYPTTRVHRVGARSGADFQHGSISCGGGGCTVG